MPTGAGKTVVFSYIASTAGAKGNKTLILVHRIELLRQTSGKLSAFDVDHGLINPKFTPKPFATSQVASVQTIVRRMEKMNFKPDLIVIDEAHHATAGTWRKIIDHYPDAKVLGVTATPIRTDGGGLDQLFDDLILGPQIQELIDLGFLCKPLVYAPETIDMSGVKVTACGDYNNDEIEILVDKPQITGNAVHHYKRLCGGAPAVAFCVSVAHAEHVAAEFRAAGIRAEAVDGSMSDDDRKRILEGLGNGSVQVVASCDLISEGTDIPAIGAAILLRPTKSLGLYLQQVGRALRPYGGKEYAVILDHVGNVMRHGLPEWDREWSLDGMKKKKRGNRDMEEFKVRQCPSCYACHKPAPTCPQCGHEYKVEAREIEEVDGELKQVTKAAEQLIRKRMRQEVAAAKTLDDLMKIEHQRGYKAGWAKHVHASRNKRETHI